MYTAANTSIFDSPPPPHLYKNLQNRTIRLLRINTS